MLPLRLVSFSSLLRACGVRGGAGSRLDFTEGEPLQQVGAEVQAGNRAVVEAMAKAAEAAMVNSVVADGSSAFFDTDADPIWPEDPRSVSASCLCQCGQPWPGPLCVNLKRGSTAHRCMLGRL
jgi:hypothetical protein